MQFYKFTTVSARSITSLITGKFWASSLNRMNDPFEDRFNDKVSKILVEGCGVFCMSGFEPRKRNVLIEPLMWAHYAANHTGIAIGMKATESNLLPFKVEYLKESEIELRIKLLLDDYQGQRGEVISPWNEIVFKFKPLFWEYENEYRQVHIGAANKYIDPRLEINEIIFGFKTRPEEEVAVWSALREKVAYKKAHNKNGKLEIEAYSPPTKIKTTNCYLMTMGNVGEDANKFEDAPNIEVPKFRFE